MKLYMGMIAVLGYTAVFLGTWLDFWWWLR